MSYIPKHFTIQELVDPETYVKLGQKALSVMDDRILMTADMIREYFNKPMTINNYNLGLHYRGFRNANCTVGSKGSMHKQGKAIDFNVSGISDEEMRQIILKNYKTVPAFKYITGLELLTNGWVHADVRPWDRSKGLFTFTG